MMRSLLCRIRTSVRLSDEAHLGASDLGCTAREGFPEVMLELRLKGANWVKVKQERAVAGPHGVQEHEIFEEGRKSV